MLAANAELDAGPGRPAPVGRDFDQLADALDIEADKRVARENALVDILGQEPSGIVARDAERGLGQVIGAEAEKLAMFGDLAGHQRGARQLDHGADEIFDLAALFGEHFFRHAVDDILHQLQFACRRDQRDHHFGDRCLAALFRHFAGRLENRAGLHFVNFGIGDAKTAAAMAEHRVELVQLVGALFQRLDADIGGFRHFLELRLVVRQEFMQWRVEQPDGHRQPDHYLEDLAEIVALFGQQLGQRCAPALLVGCQDHLAHRGNPGTVEEHMFGAAQANALGAEITRHLAVERGFRIGADAKPPDLVGPDHQHAEIADQFRLDRRNAADHDLAVAAVDGQHVTFPELAVADFHDLRFIVDRDGAGPGNTRSSHAPGNHGGV